MTAKRGCKFVSPPNDFRAKSPHADSPPAEPYVAPPPLVKAVQLAIFLRRPLLLEGEAGCGKSRLARAVAYDLGLPFYSWSVRSTSRAQEGLYSYDAILRLHDVHTQPRAGAALPPESTSPKRDPGKPTDYRTLGALGKAFNLGDCPGVVLIDEIDKADIDFPNDLLTVLDDPWSFQIPETGETIKVEKPEVNKPIVIITSNKEKGNLPAPFLRRCIYSYVEFPKTPEELLGIVKAHDLSGSAAKAGGLEDTAAKTFLEIRGKGDLHKKPGTSEFLDWLKALRSFDSTPYDAARLTKDKEPLPYPELLFKLRTDLGRYLKAS